MVPALSQGLDVDHVLSEAGIPAELVGQDGARVTGAQAARLIRVLWDATGDEMIGLGSKPIPRGTFRMVTLGLIHTPDLGTALRRLVEFASIGMGFAPAHEMRDDGGTAELVFDSGAGSQLDQLALAIGIAVGHRFAGWLIGQQIALTSVDLTGSAPPHPAEFAMVFGVEPSFDAPRTAIAFDSRHLSTPLMRSEDDLFEFIRDLPAALLFRQEYNPSTSSRVRKMIERRAVETVTAEEVAKRLTISAQHLRRLLRSEKTTFRQIKEEVLRDEAIAGLVRGVETTDELSERLGFSEPSAFRRAFRRWTGSPPGSYRQISGG